MVLVDFAIPSVTLASKSTGPQGLIYRSIWTVVVLLLLEKENSQVRIRLTRAQTPARPLRTHTDDDHYLVATEAQDLQFRAGEAFPSYIYFLNKDTLGRKAQSGIHHRSIMRLAFSSNTALSRPNFLWPFFPPLLALAIAFRNLSLSSNFCSRFWLFSSNSFRFTILFALRCSAKRASFSYGAFLRLLSRGCRRTLSELVASASCSCLTSGSESMACLSGCNSRDAGSIGSSRAW